MYDYLNNMFTDNLIIIRDFDELKKVQKYHSKVQNYTKTTKKI